MDSAQLTNLFSEYGISDAKVVYDQQTGRSKGIAFLTFASEAQATKAQAAMNGAVRARLRRRLRAKNSLHCAPWRLTLPPRFAGG